MSDAKSKRRRRDKKDEEAGFSRGSGVDYSKVADRHVDDKRYEMHKKGPPTAPDAARREPAPAEAAADQSPPSGGGGGKVSSQMEAVMRVMAGMQERTIAEKLADSNRPTWEQYKKDNEDKLNISGLDQKKMEEYRKELDAQREKVLSRGLNHRDDKKRKKHKKKKRRRGDYSDSGEDSSDDYSTDDDRHRKRHKKKHKKKHKKHKRHRRHSSESDRSDYSSDSEEDSRRRKKHKKKKKDKKRGKDRKGGDGSDDDAYRLSSFFTKGSDDEDRS